MVMVSSTPKLRDYIKRSLDQLMMYTQSLEDMSNRHALNNTKETEVAINHIALSLEENIQENIKMISERFKKLKRKIKSNDNYSLTINESFADLEQLLRHSPTLLDIVNRHRQNNVEEPVNSVVFKQDLKDYYNNYVIPLLNIFAKLENDLMSIQQHDTPDHFVIARPERPKQSRD